MPSLRGLLGRKADRPEPEDDSQRIAARLARIMHQGDDDATVPGLVADRLTDRATFDPLDPREEVGGKDRTGTG
jgi:hypothetical protein